MKNLVVFGDSYSDVNYVWDGGLPWPAYVQKYSDVKVFPYATSGGTCSNKIIEKPYPSVFEHQFPQYLEDKRSGKTNPPIKDTLFTLWIGTNDIGVGGLLDTSGALPGGSTLVDTSACVAHWVESMYDNGARNFLIHNIVPLENNILYSADTYPNFFWTGDHNATHWNLEIRQLAETSNALTSLMLTELAPRLKDAHIGLFDSHALFRDILAKPSVYLNGTGPMELRQPAKRCEYKPNVDVATAKPVCTLVPASDADNHVWYDELHPSEQVNRVIAREIVRVTSGQSSTWTRWIL
ncbi:GDSL lipase/esterase [Pterulicium gracile]|uniref:GDSL lipase/esterase n=1 Tax=Pterulicium gracile TaxID=1884261 RepID=A0A5C3QL76_9AGAR|nr:GDSL lipase/esterase [Pterula gracilis]